MEAPDDFSYETATAADRQPPGRNARKRDMPHAQGATRSCGQTPVAGAKGLGLVLAGMLFLAPAASRAEIFPVDPLVTELGPATLNLRGIADGAVFATDRDGNTAAGLLRLNPAIVRNYDTGMAISLEASILAAHDALALDRYGNDVFEKVYGKLQFGLGRFEIGQTDGAAYTLAVTGPKIDPAVSVDDPQMTFFRDPATGRAFQSIFALRSETGSSGNFAKLAFYTPKLFGVQVGLSYTPSEGKNVLPFLDAGPDTANRQNRMWEMAAAYETQLGDATAKISGGVTMGHNEWRTPGHEGLTDWAFGAQVDYPLDDAWKISAGAAYRRSNAYAFDVNDVQAFDNTGALHASMAATWKDWSAGFEYSHGTARALDAPDLDARGMQAALSYAINGNLQLAGGWQRFVYKRNPGVFYNGRQRIDMNAGFAHLRFKV
jgi:hypothetical protein